MITRKFAVNAGHVLCDGDKRTGFNEMTLINGPLIQIVGRSDA